MKLIYLKSALKCHYFDVAIGIKIPFFRVSVSIVPSRSLWQFVTTNCLITNFGWKIFLYRFLTPRIFFLSVYPTVSCHGEGTLNKEKKIWLNWQMMSNSFFYERAEKRHLFIPGRLQNGFIQLKEINNLGPESRWTNSLFPSIQNLAVKLILKITAQIHCWSIALTEYSNFVKNFVYNSSFMFDTKTRFSVIS